MRLKGSHSLCGIKQEKLAPACCSDKAMDEASGTASHLGISHSIIDLRSDFRNKVIEPFVKAYMSGLTSNPCVLCNRFIKFPFLSAEAGKRGAEFIATGHYAMVEPAANKEQKEKSKASVIPSVPPLTKWGKSESRPNLDFYFLKKGIDPKNGPVICPVHTGTGYTEKADPAAWISQER